MENLNEYREGVKTLLKVAFEEDGSNAHAAAQVLLSTWNGSDFHLRITDLCLMNETNFAAAMAVIKGRQITFKEPHQLIKDGQDWFTKLRKKYEHLYVGARYKDYY